jgi:hypothetical protein
MEVQGGMYSSYSFTTLAGGEQSVSHPGRALPQGKGPPVSIVQEAGWASELVLIQRSEENLLMIAMCSPVKRLHERTNCFMCGDFVSTCRILFLRSLSVRSVT